MIHNVVRSHVGSHFFVAGLICCSMARLSFFSQFYYGDAFVVARYAAPQLYWGDFSCTGAISVVLGGAPQFYLGTFVVAASIVLGWARHFSGHGISRFRV